MSTADAVFSQADVNQDQVLDPSEFENLTTGGSLSYDTLGLGVDDYSYGGLGYDFGGYGYGYGGDHFYSGYGLGGGSYDLGSLYNSSYGYLGGNSSYLGGNSSYLGGTVELIDPYLAGGNYLSTSQITGGSHYAANAQGLYLDPNPRILRRPATGGGVTYAQNIKVRFLQPPPVPPPGPLIVKEVRPPQPPPPPPVRVRQQAPPLPPPPPLVLREHPPVRPAPVPSKTVIRRLPGLPVPPRSVIVERFPPLPPRPRDIIIERWLRYGPRARRRTIVQRAPLPKPYPIPRNIIIQHDRAPANIVRRVQFLGVTQTDPLLYIQRYGGTLLDAFSLVQRARAAGVVENISPSGFAGSSQIVSSIGNLGYDIYGGYGGYDTFGLGLGGIVYPSSYDTTGADFSTFGADLGGTDLGGGDLIGTGLGGASSFESSSFNGANDSILGEAAIRDETIIRTTVSDEGVSEGTTVRLTLLEFKEVTIGINEVIRRKHGFYFIYFEQNSISKCIHFVFFLE
ncbi:unnamed protein product [Rotaria sordida]|uniref:EF-hand domain-containing protein n=1 Tax=Rotaria sordida TaxID=392033 RepID=A0A813TLF1_9BILA|nr:unnamed protein product [Rotaria sordida]CAF0820841.1 unnamed protein product [Rotaria sordida]